MDSLVNEGSKHIIPHKGAPFGGSEPCSPQFWQPNPQNCHFWALNRTFKRERKKIQLLIILTLISRSWRNLYSYGGLSRNFP